MPHQICGAIGILLDVHDVGKGRVSGPHLGQEQIGKADDGGENIVEVMGNATGQLANRLHFLALRQLHLKGFAFRFVNRKNREVLRSLMQSDQGKLNQPRPGILNGCIDNTDKVLVGGKFLQAFAKFAAIAIHHHGLQLGAAPGLGRKRQENGIGGLDNALSVNLGNPDWRHRHKARQRFTLIRARLPFTPRHNQRARWQHF